MATLNTFILLTATFTPATVKRKRIVAHSNSVTLYVHCLPCSSGKHLFQISAKPKYTAHTDQLYFGYESVNHDIQCRVNITKLNFLKFSSALCPGPCWALIFSSVLPTHIIPLSERSSFTILSNNRQNRVIGAV